MTLTTDDWHAKAQAHVATLDDTMSPQQDYELFKGLLDGMGFRDLGEAIRVSKYIIGGRYSAIRSGMLTREVFTLPAQLAMLDVLKARAKAVM